MNNNKKNKKIVFFSTPAFGHLNAEYSVISKLIENNYSVDWYCSKKYQSFVDKKLKNIDISAGEDYNETQKR